MWARNINNRANTISHRAMKFASYPAGQAPGGPVVVDSTVGGIVTIDPTPPVIPAEQPLASGFCNKSKGSRCNEFLGSDFTIGQVTLSLTFGRSLGQSYRLLDAERPGVNRSPLFLVAILASSVGALCF